MISDSKLKLIYLGPYQFLDYITPVNVVLRDCKTGKKLPRSIHVNKIKRYIPASDVQKSRDGRDLHNSQLPVRLPLRQNEQTPSADQPDHPVQPDQLDESADESTESADDQTSEQPDSEPTSDVEDVLDDATTPDRVTTPADQTTPENIMAPDVIPTPKDVKSSDDIRPTPDAPREATDRIYPVKNISRVRLGPDGTEQYYVSFVGYPKKYNQWISTKDMTPALRMKAEK